MDVRGRWARAALEGGGNVLDRVSSSAEGEGGRVFRGWFEGLVNIAAVSRRPSLSSILLY